jgi:ketosteroid isomerase-like protein
MALEAAEHLPGLNSNSQSRAGYCGAMSEQNVELAKEGIAALNDVYRTGDIRPWQRQVEAVCDPEVVLEAGAEAFTEGEWRGHEGAVGFVANQMEVLKDMWLRVDEYIDVDEDWLIVAATFGGEARHTGIPVEMHPFHVFRFRNGKALRWQVFLNRAEALEAAGLSE